MAIIEKEPNTYILMLINFLSIITISVCFIQKVPQIITIRRVKSAQGLSLIGLLLEIYSYSITLCYNYRNSYAILSYMEYPILLFQDFIVIYFVLLYSGFMNYKAFIGACIYFTAFGSFFFGILPREVLAVLLPFCTPIGASSKVVQLIEIIRLKNAESVSLLTWFISAFTNFTRIFSILMDSMDTLLLLNFVISATLSSSVFMAAYYYKQKQRVD